MAEATTTVVLVVATVVVVSHKQQAWFGGNGASTQHPMRPPSPYKHWENWNYCHTHGGDVDDTHTSALCGNQGPTHNPNVTRANIMGGLC